MRDKRLQLGVVLTDAINFPPHCHTLPAVIKEAWGLVSNSSPGAGLFPFARRRPAPPSSFADDLLLWPSLLRGFLTRIFQHKTDRQHRSRPHRLPVESSRNKCGFSNSFNRLFLEPCPRLRQYFDIHGPSMLVDGYAQQHSSFLPQLSGGTWVFWLYLMRETRAVISSEPSFDQTVSVLYASSPIAEFAPPLVLPADGKEDLSVDSARPDVC